MGVPPAAEQLGRYRVFATLGRGGMADVFLAVARGPHLITKLVVVKRLRPHLALEESFRAMFLDEARLAARLNHPNVIQSYEVGEVKGSYFIAMEYLDGQPLNRVLAESGRRGERIDPAFAARVVADATSGLAHAHELRDYDGTPLGIIHRDVSPHNVFVTYDGHIKLMDFGIAKAAIGRNETEVGVLKGKIAYMAPEQASGAPVDARADVFAMGIVLWELLAQKALFNPDNAPNSLHRLMNEPIPPPSTVVPVDPALEAVVMRALEKEPSRRYATARAFRDALEGWLAGHAREGSAARGGDVGAWVASLFAQRRTEMARQIRAHMAGDESGAPVPSDEVPLEAIEGTPSSLVNLEASTEPQGTPLGAPSSATPTGTSPAAPSRRWPWWSAAGAAIALALALVARCTRRTSEDRPPPVALEPASAAAPLTSFTIAPPSAPAASVPSVATPAPSTLAAPVASDSAGPRGRSKPPKSSAGRGSESSARPGYLTFDTYPWTRVTERGRAVGTTPIVHLALTPGAHVLSLDNPDKKIHTTYAVTIASDQTVTRRLGLQ